MTFINKLKWVLGILVVFLLIVTTNLIDRNNFVQVKESVETIYEDRLVAKNLIFEMLRSVQEKEIAVVSTDTSFFNKHNKYVNADINKYINKFEGTKLTSTESEVFENLKNNLNLLYSAEKAYVKDDNPSSKKVMSQIEKIKQDLLDLSEIQLNEGSRQMSISKKALDNIELFTQLEIYLLIALAIVIQVVVIYNPKNKTNNKEERA